MFKRTRISMGVLVALSGAYSATLMAQEDTQRVEITGSAIKRIEGEGALPVTVLTQADIKKSGATSVTALIQSLPNMQGFTASAQSVNGGGNGVYQGETTAALHSLPQKYTLVLLDGHRFAPYGGDGSVNLSSLPLDAIERIEVLSDGASALYGSDAIAGVVNFILKKNKTDGDAFITLTAPQHSGAKGYTAGISKGFGDLDKDGFNLLFSLSHDEQEKLQASQRSVSARGANFGFSANGKNYWYQQSTGNTEPANITVDGVTFNPYHDLNGNCGSTNATYIAGEGCRFNYAATVQDIPGYKRDSGLAAGRLKINDDTTAYAQLVLSRYFMRAQYAPPAQPMGLSATQLPSLWNTYVVPYLTANDLTATSATLGERVVGAGGRTDDYITNAAHLVLGVDGVFHDWDYSASLVLSQNKQLDNAAGGYLDFDKFAKLVADGAYNPVVPLAGQNAALASAVLHSNFSVTKVKMEQLALRASRELFKMPAGVSSLAVGADVTHLRMSESYSDLMLSGNGTASQPASGNYPVGGSYGQVPFDNSRMNYGVFGELALPLAHKLDATVSGRYDSYAKVHSAIVFDRGTGERLAASDEGNSIQSTTYKLSLRFQPVDQLLLRGSYGTGFRAPTIPDIANPQAFAGSTQTFACPFPGSPQCLPGNAQYDLVSSGNPNSGDLGLKPEKSTQWTVGFRVDPIKGLSLGADLWNVSMDHQIISSGIPQALAFANPEKYASLFINPYFDPGGKFNTIAYIQSPFNLGKSQYQGLDWDTSLRTTTDWGELSTTWSGTYIFKQRYQLSQGGDWNTDLGRFGPDLQVVFRTQMNLSSTLKTGRFANTLAMHYKSGYHDQAFTADDAAVFPLLPDGTPDYANPVSFAGLKVPSYTTFDWQTAFEFDKGFTLSGGIKNLFDRKPPLSLQNGGGGNQAGYDGRYADPTGRTFYVTLAAKF